MSRTTDKLTPRSDLLESTRKTLGASRTPAYGDALRLCRALETELTRLRDLESPEETALQKYQRLGVQDEESLALERLRAFLSFALKPQDWLDVEPFLDALKVESNPPVDTKLDHVKLQGMWADYMNKCCTYDPPDRRHAYITGVQHGVNLVKQTSSQKGQCAQCKMPYTPGKRKSGCPKCAPGVHISEDEFTQELNK